MIQVRNEPSHSFFLNSEETLSGQPLERLSSSRSGDSKSILLTTASSSSTSVTGLKPLFESTPLASSSPSLLASATESEESATSSTSEMAHHSSGSDYNPFKVFLRDSWPCLSQLTSDVNGLIVGEFQSRFSCLIKINEEGEISWDDPNGDIESEILGNRLLLRIEKLKIDLCNVVNQKKSDPEMALPLASELQEKHLKSLSLWGSNFLKDRIYKKIMKEPSSASKCPKKALSVLCLIQLNFLHLKQCIATRIWLLDNFPHIAGNRFHKYFQKRNKRKLVELYMYQSYGQGAINLILENKTLPQDLWKPCHSFSNWLRYQL